jgi:Ca2+-binding EF-hand superfamily protein
MSSLLKEAIVDAKALRDSALKNAETTIIEKYATEVKETLDKLLEQDETSLGLEGDSGSVEEVARDVPLAATDNLSEEEGDMPNNMQKEGEEGVVTIDLAALQEAVDTLEEEIEEELSGGQKKLDKDNDGDIDAKDFAALRKDEEIEITENILEALLDEEFEVELTEDDNEDPQGSGEMADSDGSAGEGEAAAAQTAAAGEQDEEAMKGMEEGMDSFVDAIVEKLTVDMGADLSGWAGRSSESITHEIEKELAHRRSTDVQDELKTLKKAQEELVFENNQLSEKLFKYEQAVGELRESLQEVNLSNARLLYTNRVLRDPSLNERQKQKIAEAISNAGSVSDAKIIHETLQSTVEAKPKRSPKSLSEAISNKRSSFIRASRQESTISDPLAERMQRLAGIK